MGLELTDNESHTPVIRGRLENNTYTHMYRLQPLWTCYDVLCYCISSIRPIWLLGLTLQCIQLRAWSLYLQRISLHVVFSKGFIHHVHVYERRINTKTWFMTATSDRETNCNSTRKGLRWTVQVKRVNYRTWQYFGQIL